MERLRLIVSAVLLTAVSCLELAAQEAQVGVAVPVAITGGALETGRAQADNPAAPSFTVGFRVLARPQLNLLKVGYELTTVNGALRPKNNVVGVQFVTSIDSISKALK